MRSALLVLAAAGLLTGCATVLPGAPLPGAPGPDLPTPTATVNHGSSPGPQPWPGAFRVRFAETELTLSPFTYCYSGADGGSICVDGFDSDPPSVGSPEELFVYVPVPGFDELTVSQSSGLDKCQTSINARTEALGGGWWVVRPRGLAGDYRVSIFASGNGGDMVADLLWQTPSDQALPESTAQIAVIADHDGRPDSYGVELSVDGLATSPVQTSATITVTAANGRSLSFEATNPRIGCGPAGSVWWDGPADRGKQSAALGDFPFTVQVDLTLDGVTHSAIATFPDDLPDPASSFLPLQFDPPVTLAGPTNLNACRDKLPVRRSQQTCLRGIRPAELAIVTNGRTRSKGEVA